MKKFLKRFFVFGFLFFIVAGVVSYFTPEDYTRYKF